MTGGDMGEFFNALRERDKQRKARNLRAADPTGFTQHTAYHWSCELQGHRLDYWPSRNKWRWRGRTYTGDVRGFIRQRSSDCTRSG